MKPDCRALPLTRRQLDTWLSSETSHSGTQYALSLFARIDGKLERDALEHTIRPGRQAAESRRTAFFDAYGQNFHRATNDTDVKQAFYDPTSSRHLVQEALQLASSIQRTSMPLFRTRPKEAVVGRIKRSSHVLGVHRSSTITALRHLTLYRPFEIGVITASNTQHFDLAANGRRRVGSISRSQQAIRINRCLRNHRMRRG